MYKVIPFQTKDVENVRGADWLEVWFDRIQPKFHESILKKIKKPFIYKVEEKGLKKLNKEVVKKASAIDLDVSTSKSKIKEFKTLNKKAEIIISYHNFKETPQPKKMGEILEEMLKKEADIVKFATHAKDLNDAIVILDFLSKTSKKDQKAICIGMGEFGILTRTTGHLFGSHMMYFAQDEKTRTAPGQITLKEYKNHII